MKEIILDGNKFNNEEEFWGEIENILTHNLEFEIGHNFNSYNDLLRGGFGVHEYEEPIILQWINFDKSKRDLGEKFIYQIFEITLDCNDSGHDCKLELY